jgi:hypothetical protein
VGVCEINERTMGSCFSWSGWFNKNFQVEITKVYFPITNSQS